MCISLITNKIHAHTACNMVMHTACVTIWRYHHITFRTLNVNYQGLFFRIHAFYSFSSPEIIIRQKMFHLSWGNFTIKPNPAVNRTGTLLLECELHSTLHSIPKYSSFQDGGPKFAFLHVSLCQPQHVVASMAPVMRMATIPHLIQ